MIERNWKRMVVVMMLALMAGCASPQLQTREAPRPTVNAPATPATFVNARAIMFVRHGDIDVALKSKMGGAVPLTDRGQERARELAAALRDAGITRIVTSEAVRTKETAAALAKELAITPEVASSHGKEVAGMPQQSEAVQVYNYLAKTSRPADVILVVHHHSVLPSLVGKFGFEQERPYDDATEFDRMYIVLPDTNTHHYKLIRARFGK